MFLMFLLLIMVINTICLFVVRWDDEKEIDSGGATVTRDSLGRIVSTVDANGRSILNEVYYASDSDRQPSLITALSCVHLVRVSNNRYVRVYMDGISRREAMDVHLDQAFGDLSWTGDFIDSETLRLYRLRMVWGINSLKQTRLAMEGNEPCSKRQPLKPLSSSVTLNTKWGRKSQDIKLAS